MDLVSQLNHLDKTLLGSVTSTFPQSLSDEDKASTNAYLVLAHAVLEEHIEGVFERHYDRLASWLVSDMVPLETAQLAFAAGAWTSEDVAVPYKTRNLHTQVAKASRAKFIRTVASNNGLKTDNVKALAKMVGVRWERFEDELSSELGDLTNLGAKRGAAGHLSPYTEKVTALTSNDDPDEIRRWVRSGLNAVRRIEEYLDGLVRSQQPQSLIVDWDGN